MHHVARSGGREPVPPATKSSRHSCSVRRLLPSASNPHERCDSSFENWNAFRSTDLKYEYERSTRPVRMRSETKMPVALEQRVEFTDVRGFGIASALVEPQHVIQGAALSRPR